MEKNRSMKKRASVTFLPDGATVEVDVGSGLLDAATAAGVEIDNACWRSGSLRPLQGDRARRRGLSDPQVPT